MLLATHQVVAVDFIMMADPVQTAILLAAVVLVPHTNPLHSVALPVEERVLARTATALVGIKYLILQINRPVADVGTEDAALVMALAIDKQKA